jgi:replicative DNA helicase
MDCIVGVNRRYLVRQLFLLSMEASKMRSEDQIKRMVNQLEQTMQRLNSADNTEEINEIRAKIEILAWVLNAPVGKYHV